MKNQLFILLVLLMISNAMAAPMVGGLNGVDVCTCPAGSGGTTIGGNISATIDVNYTFTGLPGTPANVINIGNSTVALLDFMVPQGANGATGATGAMNQTPNMTANMTAGEAGATGATGGSGGQILYFIHAASSDPITYEGLKPIPAGSTEVDETITVKNTLGKVYIDSYITDVGYPALTEIPAGLWRFRAFAFVSGTPGTTTLVFDVYNRTAGGTETLLFSTTTNDIDSLATTEQLATYTQTSNYVVSTNDRIVVKVYGQSTHTSNINLHWIYEGTTHTSHVQTTLDAAPETALSFNVLAGETLKKGQAVYLSGALTGIPIVSKADNTNLAKSRVVGLIIADTASGAHGQVRRNGVLTAVDTRTTNTDLNPGGETWVAGDLLFATTGGGLTKNRPTSGRSVKAAYSLSGSGVSDTLLAYPMENPVWITGASGEDIIARLGDSLGTNKFSIRNYANTEVAYFNSKGSLNVIGNNITGIKVVDAPTDAANKSYVDTHSANLSAAYPIGSVYITTSSTNPATLLGFGTWTQISKGRVLVGEDPAQSNFATAGQTGGNYTVNISAHRTV
jgi:hypothetical protein